MASPSLLALERPPDARRQLLVLARQVVQPLLLARVLVRSLGGKGMEGEEEGALGILFSRIYLMLNVRIKLDKSEDVLLSKENK